MKGLRVPTYLDVIFKLPLCGVNMRRDSFKKIYSFQTGLMDGCNCLHRRSVAECHAVRFCASCKICIRDKFQDLSHTGRIVSAHTSRGRLTRLRHPGGTHGCRGVFGWKQQSRSASDASFRRTCPSSFNWRRLI